MKVEILGSGGAYDDLRRLERTLDDRITFAYDTMLIEL
jgi:hypothetical protein